MLNDSGAISGAYDVLKQKIAEYSSYGLSIEFRIGSLNVSTNSEDGYLLSLRHNKTGTGSANQFTLQVAFCPDPESNTLIETNFIDFGITIAGEYCQFRYGYVFPDGTDLLSPWYSGRVTDYNIDIQNSMIIYTINGYSSITKIKDVKIHKTKSQLKALAGGTYNPLLLVKGLLEEQIADQELPYKVVFGKEDSSGNFLDDISTLTQNTDLYVVDNNDEIFNMSEDQYVMYFIKSVLNQTRQILQKDKVDNGNSQEYDSSTEGSILANGDLILYDFVVIDKADGEDSLIKIVAIDPSKKEKEKISLIFDWMSGKMTDVVSYFKPDFNGSVAIALASGLYEEAKRNNQNGVPADDFKNNLIEAIDAFKEIDDSGVKSTLDSEGKIKKVLQSFDTMNYSGVSGESSDADMLGAVGITAFFEQAVYTANLRTLGLPTEVEILTHVEVTPLIYGKEHHTAGEYIIQSQEDDISTNGFMSTFELFKVGSSKEYRKGLAEKYGINSLKYGTYKDAYQDIYNSIGTNNKNIFGSNGVVSGAANTAIGFVKSIFG